MSADTLFIGLVAVCAVLAITVGVLLPDHRAPKRPMPFPVPGNEPRRPSSHDASIPDARKNPLPLPVPVATPRPPPLPTRIVLGDPSAPDLAIERCPAQLARGLVPVPMGTELANRLSPLLQHAPSLATSAAIATGPDLYAMTFSPAVTQGLADGTYELAPAAEGGFRAFGIGSNGRIVEQGTLDPITGVQAAAAMVACWQILSIVVGQRHLANINEQLKNLASEVAEIRTFLQNSRWGRLSGKVTYMQQLFSQLQPHPRTRADVSEIRMQLEIVERETLEDQHAIDADIDLFVRQVPTIPLDNLLGTDKDAEIVGQKIEQFAMLLRHHHLALHTRGVAAQFLACLPGFQELARRRVEHIGQDLARKTYLAEAQGAFLSFIDAKIQSKLYPNDAARHRAQLKAQLDTTQRSLSEQLGLIEHGIRDLEQAIGVQLERQKDAMVLVARLDNDRGIKQLYRPE